MNIDYIFSEKSGLFMSAVQVDHFSSEDGVSC